MLLYTREAAEEWLREGAESTHKHLCLCVDPRVFFCVHGDHTRVNLQVLVK